MGQGAYGLVCSGRNVETSKPVAIKKIPKAFEDIIDCKRLLREIKILKHFKHDNVLGLVDILAPPNANAKEWKDVYIVSELMDTDLHYIIHSKQPLTDEHYKYFLYQILRGVHAIHLAHVLHRDLKPGNLLVNKNCDLKICDLARPRAADQPRGRGAGPRPHRGASTRARARPSSSSRTRTTRPRSRVGGAPRSASQIRPLNDGRKPRAKYSAQFRTRGRSRAPRAGRLHLRRDARARRSSRAATTCTSCG